MENHLSVKYFVKLELRLGCRNDERKQDPNYIQALEITRVPTTGKTT